jgi:co-chaperonin GroES (HSP10)
MEYTEQMIPIGTKVLLKKLVHTLDKKYGNILLPQTHEQNSSMGIAQVIKLGTDKTVKESGLNVGDFVLYDYYSVFENNPELVLTNVENIILRITAEEAETYLQKYVIR